jgi:hypothetical protein
MPKASAFYEGAGRRSHIETHVSMSPESRVELPPDVPEDFDVYVNGVRQEPGADYRVQGRTLVFNRVLAQEGKLGAMRWTSIFLGVAGTYRKHDTVDVVYRRDGRREVASGLRPYA